MVVWFQSRDKGYVGSVYGNVKYRYDTNDSKLCWENGAVMLTIMMTSINTHYVQKC